MVGQPQFLGQRAQAVHTRLVAEIAVGAAGQVDDHRLVAPMTRFPAPCATAGVSPRPASGVSPSEATAPFGPEST